MPSRAIDGLPISAIAIPNSIRFLVLMMKLSDSDQFATLSFCVWQQGSEWRHLLPYPQYNDHASTLTQRIA
jgi:hypothetical protein